MHSDGDSPNYFQTSQYFNTWNTIHGDNEGWKQKNGQSYESWYQYTSQHGSVKSYDNSKPNKILDSFAVSCRFDQYSTPGDCISEAMWSIYLDVSWSKQRILGPHHHYSQRLSDAEAIQ